MNKRFNNENYPLFSTIIDNIESTLECSKFKEYTSLIDIDSWDNIKLEMQRNKKLAENGFGFCITNFHEFGEFKRLIVINIKNCNRADFNQREITSIILHELGHLLNASESKQEPDFFYCFTNNIKYKKTLHDEIKEKNAINNEIYADSYANLYGYGNELISTFNKQNELFEQKIGYLKERFKSIVEKKKYEGIIMPINKNGW